MVKAANKKEETNMQFRFAHNNFNVRDLDRSSPLSEAGSIECCCIEAPDGSFIIVYYPMARPGICWS